MTVTIEATLSALARIDNGSLAISLDQAIYSESSVQAFAAACSRHCDVVVERAGDALRLQLVATDPAAARIQIGNALTELLQQSVRDRR